MKYIACERTVPEVRPLLDKLKEHQKAGELEMEFMMKQVRNRANELDKDKRVIWEEIEKLFLEKGLVEPEHVKDDGMWKIALTKQEQFFLEEKSEDKHPLEILKKLLN